MPQKPVVQISSVADQRSQRFLDTFYDVHVKRPRFPNGRPWWGNRQFPAMQGQPAGFIDLYPGEYIEGQSAAQAMTWNAPFIPETRFFQFDYNRKLIRPRYDRMLQEDMAAYDKHYAAAAAVAQSQAGMLIPKYGEPLSREIQFILGPTPRSPKIASALMAGDPWLLGFIDEPNDVLARALGLNESEARLSMRKDAETWSHRQQLGLGDEDEMPTPKGVLTADDVLKMLPTLAITIGEMLEKRQEEREKAKKATNVARTEKARKAMLDMKKAKTGSTATTGISVGVAGTVAETAAVGAGDPSTLADVFES